jgi:uncharacterized protein (TIGR04255 family)
VTCGLAPFWEEDAQDVQFHADRLFYETRGTLLERLALMFDLAPVRRYRLARPPLVQAVVQVRFPVKAHLQTLEGVSPIQDRLETLFPYLNRQQTQTVAVVVGPGAPPGISGGEAKPSWQFSDDAGWVFGLAPDNASLSIGPEYSSFEEFAKRFRAILEALAEAGGVLRCDRLGLRYIDIAEVVDTSNPGVWREWFRPELTGWGATDALGADTKLVASIAQTQLTASPTGDLSGPPVEVQAIIRHGYVPPNTVVPGVPVQPQSPGFLLDMDLFVEGPQEFNVEALANQLDVLHEQIDRFFRWTLAPEGEAYFGVEEVT